MSLREKLWWDMLAGFGCDAHGIDRKQFRSELMMACDLGFTPEEAVNAVRGEFPRGLEAIKERLSYIRNLRK